jgi:hypothetical protein
VTWVTALILITVALPALPARLAGGYPRDPGPELAALAPLAVVPAVAAVIIAACAAWWLAVLLAIPAALLVMWQLPPLKQARSRAAPGPSRGTAPAAMTLRLRLFTVNARGGAADPAAILRILRELDVDVLAVQELTPSLVSRLAAAGLTELLPFSHLDPRPGAPGVGLWARWPLSPLPPVPGLTFAAPRARGVRQYRDQFPLHLFAAALPDEPDDATDFDHGVGHAYAPRRRNGELVERNAFFSIAPRRRWSFPPHGLAEGMIQAGFLW